MNTNKIVLAFKRGYYVSKEGNLMSPKNRIIGTNYNKGYVSTKIRSNEKKLEIPAHRLQAYQKYGSAIFESGIEVRHKDGNKLNNSYDNILIGTHSENMMDIPKEIRMRKALHATSFVRKYDKKKVIEFYLKTKSYKKTMDYFNISSKGTLHFILKN